MEIDLKLIYEAYEGKITPLVRSYVLSTYEEIFKKKVENENCTSCVMDAAIKILIMENEKRKYLLKSHVAIQHKGKWYTQPTLTDEIAEAYLSENPNDTDKFKKFPKPTKKG